MAPIARVRSLLNGPTTTRLGLDPAARPSAHYCAADGRSRPEAVIADRGRGRRRWGLAVTRLRGPPSYAGYRPAACQRLSGLDTPIPSRPSLPRLKPQVQSRLGKS